MKKSRPPPRHHLWTHHATTPRVDLTDEKIRCVHKHNLNLNHHGRLTRPNSETSRAGAPNKTQNQNAHGGVTDFHMHTLLRSSGEWT